MSDFIAIANVNGKVLHLVDWDRPVWFRADDPMGDRVIPDLENMLVDGLLFFAYSDFDMPMDIFAGQRGKRQVLEMKQAGQYSEVDKARSILRSRKEPFILLAHFGELDINLKSDLETLAAPTLKAKIDMKDAKRFGIV